MVYAERVRNGRKEQEMFPNKGPTPLKKVKMICGASKVLSTG